MRHVLLIAFIGLWTGCGSAIGLDDAGQELEPNRDEPDAGAFAPDASVDGGEASMDAGVFDAGVSVDAGTADAGLDDAGAADAGAPDSGVRDAGTLDAGLPDAGPVQPMTALLRPSNPLPCADPAVVSEGGAGQVFYVFCTSMSHVWKTTNWVSFTDVRANVTFDVVAMSANGKQIGSWWAPQA